MVTTVFLYIYSVVMLETESYVKVIKIVFITESVNTLLLKKHETPVT